MEKSIEEKKEKKLFNEVTISGAVAKLDPVDYENGQKTLHNVIVKVVDSKNEETSFKALVPDKYKASVTDIKVGDEVRLKGFITNDKTNSQDRKYDQDTIVVQSLEKNASKDIKHSAYATFSGLLTSDIEIQKKGDLAYSKFSVAQNVPQPEGSEKKTIFKNGVAFAERANAMSELKKGDFVKIEGFLKPNDFKGEDTTYRHYDIVVNKSQKLEKSQGVSAQEEKEKITDKKESIAMGDEDDTSEKKKGRKR